MAIGNLGNWPIGNLPNVKYQILLGKLMDTVFVDNVTFSFLLPYHTQIRRTASFPLSPILT